MCVCVCVCVYNVQTDRPGLGLLNTFRQSQSAGFSAVHTRPGRYDMSMISPQLLMVHVSWHTAIQRLF